MVDQLQLLYSTYYPIKKRKKLRARVNFIYFGNKYGKFPTIYVSPIYNPSHNLIII